MANSPQARKRAQQSKKSRIHNASLRSHLRTHLKRVIKAIETENQADAQQSYKDAVPVIDGMVNKGMIHRNKAARHKSRLNAHIRAIAS